MNHVSDRTEEYLSANAQVFDLCAQDQEDTMMLGVSIQTLKLMADSGYNHSAFSAFSPATLELNPCNVKIKPMSGMISII